jgi:hypothetical protein
LPVATASAGDHAAGKRRADLGDTTSDGIAIDHGSPASARGHRISRLTALELGDLHHELQRLVEEWLDLDLVTEIRQLAIEVQLSLSFFEALSFHSRR